MQRATATATGLDIGYSSSPAFPAQSSHISISRLVVIKCCWIQPSPTQAEPAHRIRHGLMILQQPCLTLLAHLRRTRIFTNLVMKTVKSIMFVVVSLGVITGTDVGQGQTGKNSSDIYPGTMTSCFSNSDGDIPEDIRPFLRVPKGESPLPADKHLQVCADFAAWSKAVIKPQYVPNDE